MEGPSLSLSLFAAPDARAHTRPGAAPAPRSSAGPRPLAQNSFRIIPHPLPRKIKQINAGGRRVAQRAGRGRHARRLHAPPRLPGCVVVLSSFFLLSPPCLRGPASNSHVSAAGPKTTTPAGRNRTFNVYIPENYDGKHAQPVWMHLRGVYNAQWGGELQAQYPGMPILCRDACALWDGMAGSKREGLNPKRADNAIVVYPEAAFDDPNKRSVRDVCGSPRGSAQQGGGKSDVGRPSSFVPPRPPPKSPNNLYLDHNHDTKKTNNTNSSGRCRGGAARSTTACRTASTTSASSSA